MVAQVTITPAINIPARMEIKACLNFKPKRAAASEPVQAPVMGRGMATNNISPILSYLSIIFPRRLVRSNNQVKIRLKSSTLLSNLETLSRNSSIKGIGSILPMIDIRKA